jgi:hypothetical protein
MTILENKAVEESTYAIVIAFKDSAGNDVIPTTLTWSLSDKDGTIINSRENVSIVTPAASVTVTLEGDDLALADENDPLRFFIVEGVYDDPALGNGKPIRGEVAFEIANTVN